MPLFYCTTVVICMTSNPYTYRTAYMYILCYVMLTSSEHGVISAGRSVCRHSHWGRPQTPSNVAEPLHSVCGHTRV